ncbi:hypothetical protein NPIL_698831 [Nephila pilipes]|uniref:Uncharacterized protein n=1 Tax=Nephila pilipes TaxID=299642 RepID=A0A8X6PL73_NEPPI|nr:hypothetical protein NPIL_698831 [Nephila pilipes]
MVSSRLIPGTQTRICGLAPPGPGFKCPHFHRQIHRHVSADCFADDASRRWRLFLISSRRRTKRFALEVELRRYMGMLGKEGIYLSHMLLMCGKKYGKTKYG